VRERGSRRKCVRESGRERVREGGRSERGRERRRKCVRERETFGIFSGISDLVLQLGLFNNKGLNIPSIN